MQPPKLKMLSSLSYWKAFAAQARKEAQRLERATDELMARVEASRRESEKEKERIKAAAQRIAKGRGQIFGVDFNGRHFKG